MSKMTPNFCHHHNPVDCIIPEYLLDERSKSKDTATRDAAQEPSDVTENNIAQNEKLATQNQEQTIANLEKPKAGMEDCKHGLQALFA